MFIFRGKVITMVVVSMQRDRVTEHMTRIGKLIGTFFHRKFKNHFSRRQLMKLNFDFFIQDSAHVSLIISFNYKKINYVHSR